MLDVNPHVKVETFHEQLTSENALRICDGYDVVRMRSVGTPQQVFKSTELLTNGGATAFIPIKRRQTRSFFGAVDCSARPYPYPSPFPPQKSPALYLSHRARPLTSCLTGCSTRLLAGVVVPTLLPSSA